MRTKHQIKLDHKSKIFQNLNGATTEVELSFQQVYPKLLNTMYDTQPLVLHGNGPSKRILNTLGNVANTKNCIKFPISSYPPTSCLCIIKKFKLSKGQGTKSHFTSYIF